MTEPIVSYSKQLESKLQLLDNETRKVPTEAILNALNSCHLKAACGVEGKASPLTQDSLRELQNDCNALELTFFSLLGQLELFDSREVIDIYRELVDVVVSHEHTLGASIMTTDFQIPPVADFSDVMKYYKPSYVKNVSSQPMEEISHALPFSKDPRFSKINDALRQSEGMLSRACRLRELQIEELFEHSNMLKQIAIAKSNKDNAEALATTVDSTTGTKEDEKDTNDVSVKSEPLKKAKSEKSDAPAKVKKVKAEKKVKVKKEPKLTSVSAKREAHVLDELEDAANSPFHGHVLPTDLLRCLLEKLAARGVVVKAPEQKLGQIQRDPLACSPASLFEKPVLIELLADDNSNKNSAGGSKTEKGNVKAAKTTTVLTPIGDAVDYQSLGSFLEKQLQKPVGTTAVTLVEESIEGAQNDTISFDQAWLKGCHQALDRQRQQWLKMTEKRAKMRNIPCITSLNQVPHEAELIPNPFGNCRVIKTEDEGENIEEEWEWLTKLPGYANSVESIHRQIRNGEVVVNEENSRQVILSSLEQEVNHPFINDNSLVRDKMSLKGCLTPQLLHDLVRGTSRQVSSNMQATSDLLFLLQNFSGTVSNPQCLQDTPLFSALQPVNRANPVNTDVDFLAARDKLYGQHISSLRLGVYFRRCVERSLHLLRLGLNVLVVDSCTRRITDSEADSKCGAQFSTNDDSDPAVVHPAVVPDHFHRAQLLASIIKESLLGNSKDGEGSQHTGESKKGAMNPHCGHGPIVVVCRIGELLDFQDILQRECDASVGSNNVMRLLPYYGDCTDREVLRSYMLPEHLYTSRSHCHIVLTHYETFIQDLFYFKGINWYMMVVDSYWGILSNKLYRKVRNEISSISCRQCIMSCPSLGKYSKMEKPTKVNGKTKANGSDVINFSMYPDLSNTLSFLLPSMWTLLENQEHPYGKTIEGEFVMSMHTRRLCLQLLGAVTVVYDKTIDSLVDEHSLTLPNESRSYVQQQEMKLFNDVSEWMPWYIWDCISLEITDGDAQPFPSDNIETNVGLHNTPRKIVYTFDYDIKYTRFYVDPELDDEVKSIKQETVGCPDANLRKRVRKKPGPKSNATNLASKDTSRSSNNESGGGGAAVTGEGVVGVGVVGVKVKRAYNMTKRRAIQQGLLPPGPGAAVSQGDGRRRRGGRLKGRGAVKKNEDTAELQEVIADLVNKVAHEEEFAPVKIEVKNEINECVAENGLNNEGNEVSSTEHVSESFEAIAEDSVIMENPSDETVPVIEVKQEVDDKAADDDEMEVVTDFILPDRDITENDESEELSVEVTEHKADEIVVSTYTVDQDDDTEKKISSEEKEVKEEKEDKMDVVLNDDSGDDVEDGAAQHEVTRESLPLPPPWSTYTSSSNFFADNSSGALKRRASDMSDTNETLDIANDQPSPTDDNAEASSTKKSKKSSRRPAKKPKVTYYQRKKEAELEKALASGVLPPSMLKRRGKHSFDIYGTYLPLKLKVVSVKKYTEKEERDRSLFSRGNRVQVVVNFPGRQRFLGSFKTLEEAETAYNAALAQRNTLVTTGMSGLTRLRVVGGGGIDKSHQTLILQQPSMMKKKPTPEEIAATKFCNDIDVVRKVHDEVLEHAVRDMLQPLLALKTIPLANWESELCPSTHVPPAYAKLHGPNGFVAYVHTRRSCILGRFFKDTVKLSQRLGIDDPAGVGHGLGGTRRYDTDHDKTKLRHVDIHIGDDPSVARYHADIRYNEETQYFEICALDDEATFYIQGKRITPASGYVLIYPRNVIQLGFRVFRFLYPTSSPHVLKIAKSEVNISEIKTIQPHPLEYKKRLLDVLVSTVRLRQLGFSMEGYPTPATVGYFTDHPLSDVEAGEVQAAYDENVRAMEKSLPLIATGYKNMPNAVGTCVVSDGPDGETKDKKKSSTSSGPAGSSTTGRDKTSTKKSNCSATSENSSAKNTQVGGGNIPSNVADEAIGVYKANAKNKAVLETMRMKERQLADNEQRNMGANVTGDESNVSYTGSRSDVESNKRSAERNTADDSEVQEAHVMKKSRVDENDRADDVSDGDSGSNVSNKNDLTDNVAAALSAVDDIAAKVSAFTESSDTLGSPTRDDSKQSEESVEK